MYANTFAILGSETSFTLKQRCLDDHFTHLHIFRILSNLFKHGAMKTSSGVVILETNFQDLTAKMENFGALVPVQVVY